MINEQLNTTSDAFFTSLKLLKYCNKLKTPTDEKHSDNDVWVLFSYLGKWYCRDTGGEGYKSRESVLLATLQ